MVTANFLQRFFGACRRGGGIAFAPLCLAIGLSVSVPVSAQEKKEGEAMLVKLTQVQVKTDGKGRESLVAADKVKPGDVIEYQAIYTAKSAVKGFVATLPLPEGAEYMEGSAKPAKPVVQAATKDGKYGAEPLLRKVKGVDGKEKAEAVPYAEYRSLRWVVGDMAAGGKFDVKARVRIASTVVDQDSLKSVSAPVVNAK